MKRASPPWTGRLCSWKSNLVNLVGHARKFGQIRGFRAFQVRLFLSVGFGAEFGHRSGQWLLPGKPDACANHGALGF